MGSPAILLQRRGTEGTWQESLLLQLPRDVPLDVADSWKRSEQPTGLADTWIYTEAALAHSLHTIQLIPSKFQTYASI